MTILLSQNWSDIGLIISYTNSNVGTKEVWLHGDRQEMEPTRRESKKEYESVNKSEWKSERIRWYTTTRLKRIKDLKIKDLFLGTDKAIISSLVCC